MSILKWTYHLRSDSGSNGLVAKETVTASWSQAHFDFGLGFVALISFLDEG